MMIMSLFVQLWKMVRRVTKRNNSISKFFKKVIRTKAMLVNTKMLTATMVALLTCKAPDTVAQSESSTGRPEWLLSRICGWVNNSSRHTVGNLSAPPECTMVTVSKTQPIETAEVSSNRTTPQMCKTARIVHSTCLTVDQVETKKAISYQFKQRRRVQVVTTLQVQTARTTNSLVEVRLARSGKMLIQRLIQLSWRTRYSARVEKRRAIRRCREGWIALPTQHSKSHTTSARKVMVARRVRHPTGCPNRTPPWAPAETTTAIQTSSCSSGRSRVVTTRQRVPSASIIIILAGEPSEAYIHPTMAVIVQVTLTSSTEAIIGWRAITTATAICRSSHVWCHRRMLMMMSQTSLSSKSAQWRQWEVSTICIPVVRITSVM